MSDNDLKYSAKLLLERAGLDPTDEVLIDEIARFGRTMRHVGRAEAFAELTISLNQSKKVAYEKSYEETPQPFGYWRE